MKLKDFESNALKLKIHKCKKCNKKVESLLNGICPECFASDYGDDYGDYWDHMGGSK